MIPQNQVIAEILRSPPVPQPEFVPCAKLKLLSTIITDRVGVALSSKDKVLAVYTNIPDYFQAAQDILAGRIKVSTRSVIVFMGLDWCLHASRNQVREGSASWC